MYLGQIPENLSDLKNNNFTGKTVVLFRRGYTELLTHPFWKPPIQTYCKTPL